MIINYKFKRRNTIDYNEIKAANKVLKKGILSDFIATSGKGFNGGKYVRIFEEKLKKFYKVKHAITVNSWTSGLICAVGSLDIEPGDEIITSPWTMCATATAILHWNAIPIFADINPKTFCIDPELVKKKITKRTKAIIAVDIFGLSHDINALKKIVKGRNIKIISDSAQSPYSFYKNKLAGTQSDIGGYSYNFHKHMQTGEGGCIVTNNKVLAERIKKLRNHAEATVKISDKINNLIGFNFRLGEIEAAIGIEQLKKLKFFVKEKQKEANYLTSKLKNLNGLTVPFVPKNYSHSYYVYPILINEKKIGIRKKTILKKLIDQGVQGIYGKYGDIHLLPMYKKKIAYGKKNFPWSISKHKIKYDKGMCPIAEKLNKESFLFIELCDFDLTKKDLALICKSFHKVWRDIKK